MNTDSDSIEVTWSNGDHIELPVLWLRDNCTCQDCRVVQTTEKKFVLADVPLNLQPSHFEVTQDELRVTWPDGHYSVFSAAFVQQTSRHAEPSIINWQSGFVPEYVDYDAFIHEDSAALTSLENFLQTGVLVLINTPRQTETLEELHLRLGPMREMAFARIHEVIVDPSGYNVAHTNLALPPHNDFASLNWPPSVQALHMLANDCQGGETIVVDGWLVADQLRAEYPEHFEILCNFEVPFRMFSETTETYAENPLIRLDREGQVSHVRYSNQLMQTVDPKRTGVKKFYRAYHEFSRRLMSEEAKAVFRLNAGECLLVAGHRVLHARQAFVASGKRHLQDAYFEHDHVRNHVTVLRRNLSEE